MLGRMAEMAGVQGIRSEEGMEAVAVAEEDPEDIQLTAPHMSIDLYVLPISCDCKAYKVP
jgi:hypothetical protein